MSEDGREPSYVAAKPGEFFCPVGGKWYMCETGTKFVGCCTADPCVNGCHGEILFPAGRSSTLMNLSPGGSCGGTTDFWTCEQAPTFWGCCNADPCYNNSTCPEGKLEPAFWDRPDQYYYFKDLNVALSSTLPSATASPTPSTSEASNNSGSGKPSGAVIGGAVGGTLVGILVIAAVVFFLLRRRRRSQKQDGNESGDATNKPAEIDSPLSAGISPPPTYSWDTNGNRPTQQQWARNQAHARELAAEETKTPIRSLHTELLEKTSITQMSELDGGTAANELESSEVDPKKSREKVTPEKMNSPVRGLDITIEEESSKRKS